MKSNGKSIYSANCKQKIISGCFSDDNSYFIGIGFSTLSIWHLPFLKENERKKQNYVTESSRILKWNEISIENEKTSIELVDVKWIHSQIYILCRQKKILVFNSSCEFKEEIPLESPKCNSFELFEDNLFIGCNKGKVLIFNLKDKSIIRDLPRPLPLHRYNFDPINLTPNPSFEFANINCLLCDPDKKRLYVLKSDSTIFVWDLTNIYKLTLRRSILNHTRGVIGMQWKNGTLITLGLDLTARIWGFFNEKLAKEENPFCKYLFRILHLNNDPSPFKGDCTDSLMIKCSTVKDDFLMIGDSAGFLHVFTFGSEEVLQSPLKSRKLHSSEITCLCLTPEDADIALNINLVVTGSRDRKIHVLDCANDLEDICLLEDFLCTVISVKFVYCKEIEVLQLLSVGSDKSIVVREYRPVDFNFFVKVKVEMERVEKILSCNVDENSSAAYFLLERKVKFWSVEELKLSLTIENIDKPEGFDDAKLEDELSISSIQGLCAFVSCSLSLIVAVAAAGCVVL